MAPLRLGKLPDRETTKITFIVDAELKLALDDYAAAYGDEYGNKEAITDLIPHMLDAFIQGDRGFQKIRNRQKNNAL